MVNKALFTSNSDEWSTPDELFEVLNRKWNFQLDAAATEDNAKCDLFLDEEVDSLTVDWHKEADVVWLNPPYSKKKQDAFIKKAKDEAGKGCVVVCLIPARTDTKLWHEVCAKAFQIIFLKGRLKFGKAKNSAPFPSALVIFREGPKQPALFWDWKCQK